MSRYAFKIFTHWILIQFQRFQLKIVNWKLQIENVAHLNFWWRFALVLFEDACCEFPLQQLPLATIGCQVKWIQLPCPTPSPHTALCHLFCHTPTPWHALPADCQCHWFECATYVCQLNAFQLRLPTAHSALGLICCCPYCISSSPLSPLGLLYTRFSYIFCEINGFSLPSSVQSQRCLCLCH